MHSILLMLPLSLILNMVHRASKVAGHLILPSILPQITISQQVGCRYYEDGNISVKRWKFEDEEKVK